MIRFYRRRILVVRQRLRLRLRLRLAAGSRSDDCQTGQQADDQCFAPYSFHNKNPILDKLRRCVPHPRRRRAHCFDNACRYPCIYPCIYLCIYPCVYPCVYPCIYPCVYPCHDSIRRQHRTFPIFSIPCRSRDCDGKRRLTISVLDRFCGAE